MVTAQPVHCMRSLPAFTHEVNGQGVRRPASAAAMCLPLDADSMHKEVKN